MPGLLGHNIPHVSTLEAGRRQCVRITLNGLVLRKRLQHVSTKARIRFESGEHHLPSFDVAAAFVKL